MQICNLVMKDLKSIIQGCAVRDRKSQKMLYQMWYKFAMGICLRYSGSSDEAIKNMNEGFFFIYNQIPVYDYSDGFELWLKRVLIRIFIKQSRSQITKIAALAADLTESVSPATSGNALKYHQLIMMMQQLPQELRTFFNMYAIDGYSYKELSSIFMINEAHSKLIIATARQKLCQITSS